MPLRRLDFGLHGARETDFAVRAVSGVGCWHLSWAGVMRRFAVACVLLGCVLPAPYARAGGPAMLIGVAEDSVRQPTLAEAGGEKDLPLHTQFTAVPSSAIKETSETTPRSASPEQ